MGPLGPSEGTPTSQHPTQPARLGHGYRPNHDPARRRRPLRAEEAHDGHNGHRRAAGTCLLKDIADGGRLASDPDQVAPHLIDVEVASVIRRDLLLGHLDATAGDQAVEDLTDWPGERFGHRGLLERAWELRATVRGWDAMYVVLAEGLGATLVTTDARLGRVKGLRCPIEVLAETGR